MPTFQEVCRSLRLLQNDNKWEIVLEEAAQTTMSLQLRELFVTILLFCNVSNPRTLFEKHHTSWWDDYLRHAPKTFNSMLFRTLVLYYIEQRLQVRISTNKAY